MIKKGNICVYIGWQKIHDKPTTYSPVFYLYLNIVDFGKGFKMHLKQINSTDFEFDVRLNFFIWHEMHG